MMQVRQYAWDAEDEDGECYGNYDYLDVDTQRKVMKQMEEDEEWSYKPPQSFLEDMHSLSLSSMVQNWLTTSRAVIGALGAIVEPTLTATAAFNGVGKAAATTASAASLKSLDKCVAWRSTSNAGSGIVATIGLKQSQMRHAYTKLVMLAQIRESKRQKCNDRELENYDAALESEIMEVCGPQGARVVAFMSGSPQTTG